MLSWVGTGWNPNPQPLVGADDNGVWENPDAWGIRSGTLLVAQDGTQGFVTTRYYGSSVIVDRNNNGVLDAGNMAQKAALMRSDLPGNSYYADKRTVTRVVAPLHYGGSYIRWANMAWCR